MQALMLLPLGLSYDVGIMANENFYSSSSLSQNAPTQEEIAARAYELWVQQGCPHGRDQENWFEAERQLLAKRGASPTSLSRAKPAAVTNKRKNALRITDGQGVPLREEVTRADPDSPYDGFSEDAPLTTKVERDIADYGDPKRPRSPTSIGF